MHREESVDAAGAELADLMGDLEAYFAESESFVLVCSLVDP